MTNLLKSVYGGSSWLFKVAFSLLLLIPFSINLGMAPLDIAMSSTAVLFLIKSINDKNFSWMQETWFKILLLLWMLLVIRSVFTISLIKSIGQSLSFIRFGIFTLALQYWLLSKPNYRKLMGFSLIVALVFVVFNGYLELLTGKDLFGNHYLASGSDSTGFGRAVSLSGKLNLGAITMMMMFPAVVYLLDKPFENKYWNGLAGLFIFLLVIMIPLTGERNAMLETIVGLILTFIMAPRIRLKIVIMGMVIAIVMTMTISLHQDMKGRLVDTVRDIAGTVFIQKESTVHSKPYAATLQTGWNFFIQNPVFGIGLHQFASYCEAHPEASAYKKTYGECLCHAHNIYLEWLSGAGLLGTILFFLVLGIWVRLFWQGRQQILAEPFIIGALIAVLLRLWPFASTPSFFVSWGGVSFWWMGGWILGSLWGKSSKKTDNEP